jgi:hypothetical protein
MEILLGPWSCWLGTAPLVIANERLFPMPPMAFDPRPLRDRHRR